MRVIRNTRQSLEEFEVRGSYDLFVSSLVISIFLVYSCSSLFSPLHPQSIPLAPLPPPLGVHSPATLTAPAGHFAGNLPNRPLLPPACSKFEI
ncbi:hypothetical protein MA16_Dca015323 [Dendrobium catenatum]|uniref:Uncharacterized protein n=1 Tax=Dendrobium catenatum TaxID=906689 RepID=A0A2I0W1A7_9ASPA|nr:hypothetical protein MA16_Dca015323 [Dendrobium catenatum]